MSFCECGLVEFEIHVYVRAIGSGVIARCPLTGWHVCPDGYCFRVIDVLVVR